MFNRRKKSFPPGTFIPAPARVCAIIQLCLAFSIFLWDISQPFTNQLFKIKSREFLYQELMGIPGGGMVDKGQLAQVERNAARFEALPNDVKHAFLQGWQAIKGEKQRSFAQKLLAAGELLFVKTSPFKTVWLLLSIVIPVMLLKRREGASSVVWILPLLTLCYAADNYFHGFSSTSYEAQLFPSERKIIEQYLDADLSSTISEQRQQLKKGWQRYLVQEWAHEIPSTDSAEFELQAERGSFAFTQKRIEKRLLDERQEIRAGGWQKKHPFVLFLYLCWNLFFASVASYYSKQKAPVY